MTAPEKDFRVIKLNRGKAVLVDLGDFDRVMQHRWSAHRAGRSWYAGTYFDGKYMKMHRFILDAKKGEEIDHINHDGLDNRRVNLRKCSHKQNTMNKRKFLGTSKFKGVSWHSRDKRWAVSVYVDGKAKHLGSYKDEEAAAKAYDSAALKYFGDFAFINFPSVNQEIQNAH